MAIPIKQIREINRLLIALSGGDYQKKGILSNKFNEYDSVISALNMLGEELLATTVSRDYFTSIYNAVSEMLFVLSPNGKFRDINFAVSQILGYNIQDLLEKDLSEILVQKDSVFFDEIIKQLKSKSSFSLESNFITANKKNVPVFCIFSKIFDRNKIFNGYMLIAKDITEQKTMEQQILRAIIDAQENERLRIARDLHDSMGVHLAGQKMYISSLKSQLKPLTGNIKSAVDSLSDFNSTAISNMRAACFDLMPTALEKNGINSAITELLKKMQAQNILNFHYENKIKSTVLDKPLEITIYRIVQEFINNTIKHAKAKNIFINISRNRKLIKLIISDDGQGFNVKNKMKDGLHKNASSQHIGHGLNNIASRVKAFNGTINFTSKIGKGTSLEVFFSLK